MGGVGGGSLSSNGEVFCLREVFGVTLEDGSIECWSCLSPSPEVAVTWSRKPTSVGNDRMGQKISSGYQGKAIFLVLTYLGAASGLCLAFLAELSFGKTVSLRNGLDG